MAEELVEYGTEVEWQVITTDGYGRQVTATFDAEAHARAAHEDGMALVRTERTYWVTQSDADQMTREKSSDA